MRNRFCAFIGSVIVTTMVVLIPSMPCRADAPIKVVTTLPTFAALVAEVGGDLVEVTSVASPHFNPHFIEPRPSDVLRVKRAALFVHGGLDLEAWRSPLLDAVARPEFRIGGGRQLDLSQGVTLLNVPTSPVSRSQGDIHLFGNPHFWNDPETGLVMAKAIAAKLTELYPEHAALFASRESVFRGELEGKIAEWKSAAQGIRGKKVVGYHDEWVYLMRFLGLRMEQFLEPKPGISPTPQRLLALREYLRFERIRAILQPTYFPSAASESLAAETGARVLVLCQSVGELPVCSDYLHTAQYNIQTTIEALRD